MVFYRKYRPQKIQELDSEEIRQTLYSVFSGIASVDSRLSNKKKFSHGPSVPHAFLFTGPKGLGKTSAARIVAKVINCERLASSKLGSSSKEKKLNASPEPCNKCKQCVSITNSTNLDVLEIDAASNRGIDEIRDLREKIRLSPVSAFRKIYIIDEVHMLTAEAFNALLKTLEEPPKHVVFILCTTELHKVPETIISRCFHISFKLATDIELVRSFERISKEERLPIDKDAISLVAKLSQGSFRDGVKILEEMAFSSHGKKITKELIGEKYQISNIKFQVSQVIKIFEKKDVSQGLKLVEGLAEKGTSIKYFIEELISGLHSLLLFKVGVGSNSETAFSELDIVEIKELVELLTKAYAEIKYSVLPELPLELAIIEWGQGQKNPSASLRTSADQDPTPLALGGLRGTSAEPIKSPHSSVSGSASISDKKDIEQKVQKGEGDNDLWKKLIDRVKTHNHSIAGILRSCSLDDHDKKTLKIKTGYKFHKDKLSENKARTIIEKSWTEITGNTVSVFVFLKE